MASSPELTLPFPHQPTPAVPRTSEAWLLRRARKGSPDAIEALIRRHWPRLYRAALLIVRDAGGAEDVAQEAMLSAVQSLDRFDWRRPLGPWLHRIAVNRSLDHLRAVARRAEVGLEADQVKDPGDVASDALSRELVAAMSELDPIDRAIIVLRHLLGYRSNEISSFLEIPAATVRTRLRRALGRLRTELESGEKPTPQTAAVEVKR